MADSYEAFFGLSERPFSLTADPKYFFKSRAHGRALETITFGLRGGEQFLVVAGDLGVGKTILCRTLAEEHRSKGPVSIVRNPLLTAADLFRLLLDDFAALPLEGAAHERARVAAAPELRQMLRDYVSQLPPGQTAIVVIDEAHTIPAALVEHLFSIAAIEREGARCLQFVLAGQSGPGEIIRINVRALDERASTTVRVTALAEKECAEYVAHRLRIAGGQTDLLAESALHALFAVSAGLPRLVNLLCERGLQDAASRKLPRVDGSMIDAAANALELARARARRFRWFSRRVS